LGGVDVDEIDVDLLLWLSRVDALILNYALRLALTLYKILISLEVLMFILEFEADHD